MKFLDLTGLQYFYDKYLRPLKDAAFKNVANNLTTTESGFVLDARQGKELDDKITELNGNLNGIHFEVIESDRCYVKKYENGWFEAYVKTAVGPNAGGENFTFTQFEGSTVLYRAPFTNFGFGIKATEVYDLEVSASNSGMIWCASCRMNANMQAIDGYVVQHGSDNTRTTTLRAHVTGKWK